MYLRSPWQRSRRWIAQRVEHEAAAVEQALHELTERSGPAPREDGDAIDLERALGRLGDTARAVVWLHDVEGYTHGEIGALFGASASFSKSQLARAHARLRAELQSHGVDSSCMPVSSIS
jgi:RNA polymerase sigma-70 factor (ECF subfamily)